MSSISSTPETIAVWGDELLEKGDPLGEIIALSREPSDRLAGAQRQYERAYFTGAGVRVLWKNGVIDEIHAKTDSGRSTATEIVNCPAARFLRVLDVEVPSGVPAENPIPVFVEHGLPTSLRQLKLWIRAGKKDLTELYSVIPNIERLDLWRPDVLGRPDLPQLRVLRIVGFDKSDFVTLARANIPRLETLAVAAMFWEELADVALPNCPDLRTLAVTRPPWEEWFSQDDGDRQLYSQREVRALLDSPLTAGLRELEFREWLKGPMLAAIVAEAAAFERFERIRFLRPKDPKIQNLLAKRFGARLEWLP